MAYNNLTKMGTMNFKLLYSQLSRTNALILMVAIILTCMYAQTIPIFGYFITRIYEGFQNHPENDGAIEDIALQVSVDNYLLATFNLLVQAAAIYLFLKLGQACCTAWKQQYYKALLHKPADFYDKNDSSSMSSQLEMYGASIEDAAGIKIAISIMLIAWTIGAFALSAIMYTQLFVFWLIAIPFIWSCIGLGYYISNQTVKKRQEKYTKASGISDETFEGIKTTIAFNQQDARKAQYLEYLKDDAQIVKKVAIIQGLTWGASCAIMFATTGVSFVILAKHLDDGDENWFSGHNIQPDDLLALSIAVYTGIQNAGFLTPLLDYIIKGMSAVNSINTTIKENDTEIGEFQSEMEGNVLFTQVSFAYSSSPENYVLKNIDLEIHKGQFVGIVGETGSGKSTIIQLIEKFYDPNEGSIKLDGVDIKLMNPQKLRKQIGYVSQEPILFSRSIEDNIRLGNTSFNQDQILEACRKAQALKFIERHPDGLSRVVGQKGGQLSGGEKQRVVLSRLFLHDYKMIILDEGTSALDLRTEALVMKEILEQFGGVTMIAVAQRVSTVRRADTIIVMKQGSIVEKGNHDQLMAENKFYALMVNAQGKSKVYQDEGIEMLATDQVRDQTQQTIQTQDKETTTDQLKMLKWAFSDLPKYWRLLTLAFMISIVAGACFPLIGFFFGKGFEIAFVSPHKQRHESHLMWGIISTSVVEVIAFALLFFVTAIVGSHFAQDLRDKCITKLVYSDPEYFEAHSSGVLSNKLGKDCMQASNLGGTVLSMNMLSFTSLTLGVIYASTYDEGMALAYAGFIPPIVVAMVLAEHFKQSGASKNYQTEQIVNDSLTNIKTVKALQLEDQFTQEFDTEQDKYQRGQTGLDVFKSFAIASFTSFIVAGNSTSYLVGINRLESNFIDRYDVLVAGNILLISSWSYFVLAPIIADAVKGYHSILSLSEIYKSQPKIDAQNEGGNKSEITGLIEYKNVSFQFPYGKYKVLNDVDFTIPAGTSLGICGTTGSGKSTVVQLLLRFYDVQGGSISIDGVDIRNYNLKHLRNKIAWVGQEPLLFKGSFRYNIQFGKDDALQSDIEHAAKLAQADSFINSKPEKYETQVGYRGSQLSGGQKQRVGIARALIKNAPILVMDEASSALDTETEQKLQYEIDKLNKTMIIVAHRLNTIQNCTKIMVMELGQIVEYGSHDDLIKDRGIYYSLLQLV